MKKKTVAIIQARMDSTRLPGKVLMEIEEKPMLWHIINRLGRVKIIDKIVVATTINPKDQPIIDFCIQNNVGYFRGSEEDVLERFYLTSKQFNASVVIRLTADCPLIDPDLISIVLCQFFEQKLDYIAVATGAGAANKNVNHYPDGLDCEVFTSKALHKAYKKAYDPREREHATMYIWKRSNIFRTGLVESSQDYSNLRFVVDYPEDLRFVRSVYSRLYPAKPDFSLDDIMSLLQSNPDILAINNQKIGQEGYEQLWK